MNIVAILFLFCITFNNTENEILFQNASLNAEALLFCRNVLEGWLQFADPEIDLFPRNLKGDTYWNAKDCSADNYPFITLSAYFTNRYIFETRMKRILKNEQKLCNRVDRLPDDWDLIRKTFRQPEPKLEDLIFGSAEYIKDGLLPLTEYLGPTEWSERMIGLMEDIWKYAKIETETGLLPDISHEVGGDLLQGLCRIYWLTGVEKYKEWAFQLGDYFLLYHLPIDTEYFQLDDHGCEIFGGLSEVYLLSAYKSPDKRERWREPIHRMVQKILKVGRNQQGLFYDAINPKEEKVLRETLTDNWGYNYNAIATIGIIDNEKLYLEEIQKTLDMLWDFRDYPWENDGADGLADSLEGCLNLLNRFHSENAEKWADYTAQRLLKKQRPSGIVEGWHGDGNTARTMLMYALWKSKGCYLHPWNGDLSIGAIKTEDKKLQIVVKSCWNWTGKLHFDVARHREFFHFPIDYPRLNQFPEWFTIEKNKKYIVRIESEKEVEIVGKDLLEGFPLSLPPNSTKIIIVYES